MLFAFLAVRLSRRDNLLIVKGKGQRVRGRVGSLRTFLASMLIHFRLQGQVCSKDPESRIDASAKLKREKSVS